MNVIGKECGGKYAHDEMLFFILAIAVAVVDSVLLGLVFEPELEAATKE